MNGERDESKRIGSRESQESQHGHAEGVLCKEEILIDVGLGKYDMQGHMH